MNKGKNVGSRHSGKSLVSTNGAASHGMAINGTAIDGAVGYRRPPQHTRFRKGQSGNPKGRGVGSKNLSTVVLKSARELVTVKDAGRARTMTKVEAMTKALSDKAVAGDPRATQHFMQKVERFEERREQSAPPAALDAADELVVKQLFLRIAAMQKGGDQWNS